MSNPWEMDWGQPQPAASAPPDRTIIRRGDDPYKAAAETRAQEDQQFQREKFRMEMDMKQRELAQPKSEASAKARSDAIAGYTAAQALRRYVTDMRSKFEQGPGSTSGVLGVQDYFGTQANTAFDQAGNAPRGFIGQALGFTGSQLNTPAETEAAVGPFLPKSSDFDPNALDKIKRIERLADDAEARAIMILGGRPNEYGELSRDEPAAAEVPGAAPAAQQQVFDGNAGGERLARATGDTRTVDNPELAGVRGEYLRRLEQGQSGGEIVSFLRSAGVTDPKLLATAAQQAAFRKKNPGVPIAKYNTSQLDDMDVPLSGFESAMNSAAGTAGGAYAMRAGQAISAGTLDNIVGMTGGNEERARLALEDAKRQNPTASLIGDLSGAVIGGLGAEAGLAARGVQAGFGRSLAADSAFGAATGAGQADNADRVMGALGGAATAGAGSALGTGAMRGLGSAISPNPSRLADLYSNGVRPTLGQRVADAGGGKGLKGLVGKAINATEEQLSSVPIVGSAIRGARQEARDQFQTGAFNQALNEIGETLPKGMGAGTAAHTFTQKKFDAIYDKAREGMRVAADEELSNDLGSLAGEVGNLAAPSAKRFYGILENVVMRRVQGGTIERGAYKKVQADIGKVVRGIRKSQSGDGELADALEGLQGALDSAARRHSDPESVQLLDAADRGYAKFVTIENASARGGAAKDAGTFSPTDFSAAVKGGGSRVRSKAYSQGQGLMQDYAEQGMSLADRVPNSGTPERVMAAGGLAAGAGYLEPTSAGLLGALGALYAPGVRRVTKGAMAPRGPKAQALGNKVRSRARIAGAVGAGAALSAQKDDDR